VPAAAPGEDGGDQLETTSYPDDEPADPFYGCSAPLSGALTYSDGRTLDLTGVWRSAIYAFEPRRNDGLQGFGLELRDVGGTFRFYTSGSRGQQHIEGCLGSRADGGGQFALDRQ
jgi:hypothetical protein